MLARTLRTVAVLACTSQVVLAQSLSFVRDDDAARTGARGIVAADVNRDGWIDLATANTGRNTVTVLRNRGASGGFTVLHETAVGAGPFSIAAGDLDRDGVPDLVVTTPDADAIEVLYGRADGTLRSRVTLTGTGASRGVTLTDITRDGRLDLVYTDYNRHLVVVRPGTSSGFGTPLPTIPVGRHPQDVVAGDFNHDGDLDLAVANNGLARLTILYGHTSGAFTRTDVPAPAGLNVLAVGDMNHDGWLDVVAASTAADRIAVYRGSATGFTMTSMAAGASPRGLAIADVNRDGRPDLLAANRSSSTITLWLAAGTGGTLAFTKWGDLPAGDGSRAVAAGDLDNDGRIDLVTGNEYTATVTRYSNDTAFPRGAFAFEVQPITGWGGVVADFNHNGQWDIVNGQEVVLDDVTHVALPPYTLPDTQGRAVAVGDLNRDGHDDLVLSEAAYWGADGGHIDVLSGDGRGAFTRTATYDGLSQARHLALVDLDRDGWLEIVVGGYEFANSTGVTTVLTRRTDGTYKARRTTVPDWIRAFQIADLDRDGTLDVILAYEPREALQEIEVFLGDGAGGFSSRVQLPQTARVYGLALADLNLDGRLDIVTTDGPNVNVQLATGTLAWGPMASYPIVTRRGVDWQPWAIGIQVADVTHDGVPDVVAAEMAVLPGRPDGTLAPSEAFAAPCCGPAVDWNHDGLIDFVGDGYSVLLNRAERPNSDPVARITTDLPDPTISYESQFGFAVNQPTLWLTAEASSDADFHALEFEWQDAQGRTLGWGPYFTIGSPDPLRPGTHTLWLIARDGRGGESRASYTITVTPTREIVLWPGTWGDQMHPGAWQSVQDETAAAGSRLWHPNAHAPKVETPLAAPPAYFEYFFVADPTQTYKLWIRGQAQSNSPYNDSLWVQCSGSATVSGQAAYQIGTTSGLAINIEECAGCGLSGWGWRDDGWGARNVVSSVLLRFPEGGPQTLQLQIREDGVSIDQIVLSSETYLTTAPGPAKNDATILEETQHYTGWD